MYITSLLFLGCDDATVMIAWCGGQETDIVEVSNEKDFQDCTNLVPTTVPATVNDDENVDGFISVQHTKSSVGTYYYASQSYCKFGFKVAIKILKCSE